MPKHRDNFDEWDGADVAEEIALALGARGVVIFAFGESGRYSTAWTGRSEADTNAMAAFVDEIERTIVPESPRDRGEVGPDPVLGKPPGQEGR